MKLVTSLLRMNNQRLFLSEWTKYKLYNIGNCAETLPLYGLTLLGTSCGKLPLGSDGGASERFQTLPFKNAGVFLHYYYFANDRREQPSFCLIVSCFLFSFNWGGCFEIQVEFAFAYILYIIC